MVGESSGRLKLPRDSPACVDLGATGEVVSGGAGADDEGADDWELSIRHADGATIQSMNCQAAAMRVTSSRTVVMPWANKWRNPDGRCSEPSVPASVLNVTFPIEAALLSTSRVSPHNVLDRCSEQSPTRMAKILNPIGPGAFQREA